MQQTSISAIAELRKKLGVVIYKSRRRVLKGRSNGVWQAVTK